MAAAPVATGAGVCRGRRSAATVAAWGGWGGRPRPGNILLQLRQGQLTGRGLVRAVQVRGGRRGGARQAGRELAGGRGQGLSGPLWGGAGPPWPAAGLLAGRPDAVSCGGAVCCGRLEAPGRAEQGWAAVGIDGAYEPGAQFSDPPFPAPRLHVWGTLTGWLYLLQVSGFSTVN